MFKVPEEGWILRKLVKRSASEIIREKVRIHNEYHGHREDEVDRLKLMVDKVLEYLDEEN